MPRHLRHLLKIAFIGMLLFSSGCAATSTFVPYPHIVQPLKSSLGNGIPLDISHLLAEETGSRDTILYSMERGRYAQLSGKTSNSIADFNRSIIAVARNDEKALLTGSGLGANAAAILVNDNAIPYEGDSYERVLLHHYQALNFLKARELEKAGVEVRRANAEQNEALLRHQREIEAADKEIGRKNQRYHGSDKIISQYARLDETAGRVKNSFQNAYTFYLSAFIYELLDQPYDAYIDFKRALEIFPENSYVRGDVFRLAARLEMLDDLEDLRRRFPSEKKPPVSADHEQSGELLLLFEDGLVPPKHELKLPLPILNGTIVTLAIPFYDSGASLQTPLSILSGGKYIGKTETICDVRALAVRALKEKAPSIALRQVARAAAKLAGASEAKRKMGDFGELVAFFWNIFSENADLRSWLTLPANAQILRVKLPAGVHGLQLNHPSLLRREELNVRIAAGGKTVLHLARVGQQLYRSVTTFGAAAADLE